MLLGAVTNDPLKSQLEADLGNRGAVLAGDLTLD
jgi:hypothetical protein